MTNGVLASIAVRLVKEVDAALPAHRRARYKPLGLIVLLGRDLADRCPVLQVAAFGNAHAPAVVGAAIAPGGSE